jgi:hypothetical protein
MRITIACPKGLSVDANQLAMVLGQGAADGATFGALTWIGADGATYAVASLDTGPDFLDRAAQPLTRPAWDLRPYQISMAGAARAQAALRVWTGGQGTGPKAVPQATANALVMVASLPGPEAIAAMGLRRVEVEFA